jgi:polyhydroxyalkanoate synthase
MVAPTNFFWLNPVAMQRCVETGGESLRKGCENFLRDVKAKNILMVEPDAFTVGESLATTPGKVVFRNHLVELIHYAPTTEKVRAMPIVIITPWINKFYILDLTDKKSMVKYLTDQGFSVFITSWKNPDAEMSGSPLRRLPARRRQRSRARRQRVLQGAAGASGRLLHRRHAGQTYMAWANKHFAKGEGTGRALVAVHDADRLFAHPGDIDVFIDEACIGALEESMAKKRLPGRQRNGQFLPHAALEPPDLALLGAQLPARRIRCRRSTCCSGTWTRRACPTPCIPITCASCIWKTT